MIDGAGNGGWMIYHLGTYRNEVQDVPMHGIRRHRSRNGRDGEIRSNGGVRAPGSPRQAGSAACRR